MASCCNSPIHGVPVGVTAGASLGDFRARTLFGHPWPRELAAGAGRGEMNSPLNNGMKIIAINLRAVFAAARAVFLKQETAKFLSPISEAGMHRRIPPRGLLSSGNSEQGSESGSGDDLRSGVLS